MVKNKVQDGTRAPLSLLDLSIVLLRQNVSFLFQAEDDAHCSRTVLLCPLTINRH